MDRKSNGQQTINKFKSDEHIKSLIIVKLQLLGLGVDLTLTWDNNDSDNDKNNPHLNFLKGTVLGDMEQKIGIRGKR